MMLSERLHIAANHPDTQDHIGLLHEAGDTVSKLAAALRMFVYQDGTKIDITRWAQAVDAGLAALSKATGN